MINWFLLFFFGKRKESKYMSMMCECACVFESMCNCCCFAEFHYSVPLFLLLLLLILLFYHKCCVLYNESKMQY